MARKAKTIKLCIDAGHGMSNRTPGKFDSGAVAAGIKEANVALEWALTVKYFCVQLGIPFYLIRDDNTDPSPVGQRDDKAERAGCTHMLVLHCNSGGGAGPEAFYRDAADQTLGRLALASIVGAANVASRGLKHEAKSQHPHLAAFDFDGPLAYLEMGFIDSARDRKYLTDSAVRTKFAKAFLAGLMKVNP